jgi:hypothetical protein
MRTKTEPRFAWNEKLLQGQSFGGDARPRFHGFLCRWPCPYRRLSPLGRGKQAKNPALEERQGRGTRQIRYRNSIFI